MKITRWDLRNRSVHSNQQCSCIFRGDRDVAVCPVYKIVSGHGSVYQLWRMTACCMAPHNTSPRDQPAQYFVLASVVHWEVLSVVTRELAGYDIEARSFCLALTRPNLSVHANVNRCCCLALAWPNCSDLLVAWVFVAQSEADMHTKGHSHAWVFALAQGQGPHRQELV